MADELQGERRVDRIVLAGLSVVSLVLYWVTLCPTVFWYDSAEYATGAAVLGIPHPPGYPLYTMIGWLFTLLPLEPAYAVNLMSAIFGAGAVGLTYAVVRKLGGGRFAAAVGGGTLATGQVFWNQAIIAEVYTPGLMCLLSVLLLLLHALERRRPMLLVLAAGLAGLGLGLHLFIATCGVGFAVLVLGHGLEISRPADLVHLVERSTLWRRFKIAAACLGAALLGSCIFLYIPLRASMKPALNFQDPSNWETFSWFVTGGNYKGWFLKEYDFGPRLLGMLGIFYDQLLVIGLALTLIGLVYLARKRALQALGLVAMAAGNIYFFFNYPVHDVEVFFLPTVAVCCVLVGVGVEALMIGLDRLRDRLLGRPLLWFARIAVALFPLSMGIVNYSTVDLSSYTAARDFGEALCKQLPQGAIIVNFTTPPEWKNHSVFGYYYQIVLRRRLDVKVLYPMPSIQLAQLLSSGAQVYMYFPHRRVTQWFEVEKDGVIFRVTRPRPPRPPPLPAPR